MFVRDACDWGTIDVLVVAGRSECCRYLNPGVSLSPAKLPIMCCPSLGRLLALHFATRVADLKGLVRIMHRNYQVENWSVRVERESSAKKKID